MSEVAEAGGGQTPEGLLNLGQEFALYSKFKGKSLKGLKKASDIYREWISGAEWIQGG